MIECLANRLLNWETEQLMSGLTDRLFNWSIVLQAIQLMESDDEEDGDGFPVEIDKQVDRYADG